MAWAMTLAVPGVPVRTRIRPLRPIRDRDVGEDPAEPLVRAGPRARAIVLRHDVDVAVGARRLVQPELGDVARDGRLGDLEALLGQGVDDLALAADRRGRRSAGGSPAGGAVSSWPPFTGRGGRSRGARAGPPGPTRADPRAECRVGEGPFEGTGRGRVGDDRLGAVPAERAERGPDLGHHPAGDDPGSMSVSASPAVSASRRRPSASRTPSTSVSSTSWRAPSPAAIPAAASSALTLQTIPSSSRASGATTGTWPTRIASSRSRRSPTTRATSPRSGIRSATSRPPSTPESPTASTPRSRRPGHELAVDDAAQDGRGHLERLGVGDPQAALEPARHAEPLQPFGDPLAAAVDEHDRTAPGDGRDLVEHLALVGDGRATELDDEDFAHVVYSEFSMT